MSRTSGFKPLWFADGECRKNRGIPLDPSGIAAKFGGMTSHDPSRDQMERFLHETEFLLRLMPDLEAVRRKKRGWDEFGGRIAAEMERDRLGKPDPDGPLWRRAKRVVHTAMTGSEAKHAAIRTRVRSSPKVTAVVLADLSLWLAGELRVPISVTKRLVPAMLVGVAESKGDWNALAD